MKFKFKIQDYQTKAVESVIDVFKGQPYIDHVKYTRDLGIREKKNVIKYKDIEGNEQIAEKGSLLNVIDNEIESKEITKESNYNSEDNSEGSNKKSSESLEIIIEELKDQIEKLKARVSFLEKTIVDNMNP